MRLVNNEFPWNPDDLSEENPVEGPSEPITTEMIIKAISIYGFGEDGFGYCAEKMKPVNEAGEVEVS